MSLQQVQLPDGARLLEGKRNWWFLGRGGVVRLGGRHVTPEGALLPDTERRLRERGMFASPPARSYALTVLTSTNCNLGCGYCFQNIAQDATNGSRPPRIARTRLTSETITSILGFTERQMAAAELERLRILLFGGEPLLNPRGCLELLERASDIGMTSAWMISNTTLLTPRLAGQLSDLGLDSVQVTFDGDRADHDRIRVNRADNGGTYDKIVRNIVAASEVTPIRWTLRVNVSQETFDGVDALIDRLAAELDPSRCALYFARVGDVGIGYANDLLHTGELSAHFTRWQRRALELGFTVSRPGARRPCRTCGHTEGRYGAVISADGTLASCWETAGKPDWEVGTAASGYLPADATRDRWIACEDLYRYDEDTRVLARFRDDVDATLLDYLDETERL
ncbi:radical SAM protein [Streptomyces anulatus]|uniref:radical SAM protein n=1 Tax=Streptomyces anulatus TaxID=1892 RepID=UPI0037AFBA7F|nr:radical SAM protein [Streptomyces anulatus]WTD13399.1 radical SAM protein [Streptomyces anulatus]WTE06709.1 radical SAM protein [Streptomyces anulatus]